MIVMSSDLDALYTAFMNNKLPPLWESVSFASLKTLGSWVTDLVYRVQVRGEGGVFPCVAGVLMVCCW
jgi:dynein heavy chain